MKSPLSVVSYPKPRLPRQQYSPNTIASIGPPSAWDPSDILIAAFSLPFARSLTKRPWKFLKSSLDCWVQCQSWHICIPIQSLASHRLFTGKESMDETYTLEVRKRFEWRNSKKAISRHIKPTRRNLGKKTLSARRILLYRPIFGNSIRRGMNSASR